jgi:hypothetical protein
MFPSAGDEHDPNHDPHKKERDIRKPGQLWKQHALIIRSPSTAPSRKKKRQLAKLGRV